MASCSSSSSPRSNGKYEVFLSFRGVDTRENFTSHLHSALCEKGIETFIDDNLKRGEEISEYLLDAIEASIISVIIFSEGYASSRWCLDELVKILQCKRESAQIVIPVFYRVDPSDVRNQTGTFGNSFSKLQERFKESFQKLQTWRNALKEAAGLSGFHSQNIRPESELIKRVVNHTLERLAEVFPSDSETQLVGVESRIEEIESLLRAESKNVYSLGIWGIGGIGKTTIAWAIFLKISKNFEGSCFLQNVREESEKGPGGLASLQQKLLSEVLKDENVIANVDFNFRRLSRRKVLIVLDDVTDFRQIKSLIRSPNWFVPESRIIITTRDQQVLKNWGLKEEDIYEMKALAYDHALRLFSRHAFKQNCPELGYKKLSDRVIKYAHGVPLALEILGAFLFGRRKEEWDSATKKLEMFPPMEIQKILKISYDGLDDYQQSIFLDIACFFVGEDKDRVKSFLDGCDSFDGCEIDLRVLVDKSLITISKQNIIRMHDLLRDMGREIVREESPNDPGRRSRLWHARDICKVLTKNTGTEAIKGISLDMGKVNSEIQINPYTFSKMTELRVLKFYGYENKFMVSSIEGVPFAEVRYFEWHQCPLKTLNIRAENLVSLKMWGSKVKQLWDDVQNLVNLKEIDLSFSKSLTKLPDLSQAQHLQILKLLGCSSLTETHSSIQYLNKLEVLDLWHCQSLTSLPTGIHSKYLKLHVLFYCSKLKNFPEISSCHIHHLNLIQVGIEELPPSIECLSNLQKLDIDHCSRLESISSSIFKLKSLELIKIYNCSNLKGFPEVPCCNTDGSTRSKRLSSSVLSLKNCSSLESLPSSLCMFKSLRSLEIIDCKKLKRLPDELGKLEALEVLRVEGAAIRKVPESIGQLALLSELKLNHCSELEYISSSIFKLKSPCLIEIYNCSNLKGFPEIPSCNTDGSTRIKRLFSSELSLRNCSSLESLPSSLCMFKSLTSLEIIDCKKLERLPDELGNLEALEVLRVEGAAIKEVPESIGQLALLSKLVLNNCSKLEYITSSIFKLNSYALIGIYNCSNLKGFPEIPSCNTDGSTKQLFSCMLGLYDCSSLESLPSSLCMLKSLTSLKIIRCPNFERLPDEIGNLKALKELRVGGTAIRELPESLGQLALLCILELINCPSLGSLPSSLCTCKSLTSLGIIDCENFKRLPDELGNLEALRVLIVKGTTMREVPENLSQLSIQSLELSINNLERIPESFNELSSQKSLELFKSNLDRIPEYLKSFPSKLTLLSLSFDLTYCMRFDEEQAGERWMRRSMYFPGNEIPKWFRNQSMGSSVTLETPPSDFVNNKIVGFVFCAVVAFPASKCVEDDWERNLYAVHSKWKRKFKGSESLNSRFLGRISYVESDHVSLGSYLFDGSNFGTSYDEVSFHISPCSDKYQECCQVKKCGIHIVYAQDSTKYSSTPSQL